MLLKTTYIVDLEEIKNATTTEEIENFINETTEVDDRITFKSVDKVPAWIAAAAITLAVRRIGPNGTVVVYDTDGYPIEI